MKNKKRLDGKKKLVTFSRRMEADIRSFCRDKGIESESELIRQAVGKYIYADHTDETLKLQGLKKLEEKTAELRDMIDIAFNYMRLMHVSTLAYHPEIDPQMAGAAFNSATARHDKFFSAFADSLKNNPPFFERLLHKFYQSGGDDGQN